MAKRQKCPHCSHMNVEKAVYCFQCGLALHEDTEHDSNESGVARRSQRTVKAIRDDAVADSTIPDDSLPGTDFLLGIKSEEPVTCLSCGALNRPKAVNCRECGTTLFVADETTHLVLRASARTDVGQVRENNEDSIGLWAIQGMLLALVADGMGGAVAGEEASRLTVEAVQADFVGGARGSTELLTLAEELISEKLAAAVQAANKAVMGRIDEDAALRGMGTTATLVFVRGRRALLAHVGDSRAYLVDAVKDWITQITSDHSFVEALLIAGHITEKEAIDHPMKNVLYRALGQNLDTSADLYDRYLRPGDRIVVCSDGLTRHVTPDEIREIVLEDEDPDRATKQLIDLANHRGGEDNISAVVIILCAEEIGTEREDDDENLPS